MSIITARNVAKMAMLVLLRAGGADKMVISYLGLSWERLIWISVCVTIGYLAPTVSDPKDYPPRKPSSGPWERRNQNMF
jgi:hypothetical protein